MTKTKHNRIILPIIIVSLIIVLSLGAYFLLTQTSPQTNPTNQSQKNINITNNTVARIIDGDTFELASGEIVRLICMDTPEKGQKGAQEATDFLSSLILGKEVRLENDTDDRDAYNRLLRYVYIDNIFVNKELVKQGYATVFRYGNDTAKCDEIEGK